MTRPATIEWVGVVVPAHNEVELLPACLEALAVAAAAVDVAVDVLVVLDSCTDGSAQVRGRTTATSVQARNVGVARRAGFARVSELRPAGVPEP